MPLRPGALRRVCYCCQFLGFRRPVPSLISRPILPLQLYSARSYSRRKPPPENLIILEPPGGKRPKYQIPNAHEDPLDHLRLNDLSSSLLTYEREAVLDATRMEISLLKPQNQRVSKERYQQLHWNLFKAFNIKQLRSYYEHALSGGAAVPKLRKSAPKTAVVNGILKHRWGIQIAEEIAEREDVVVDKEIESNNKEIFFLIGEDGRTLRQWAHDCSARISIDVKNTIIHIRASQASVEEIEKKIVNMLRNIIYEDFDMQGISRIGHFEDKYIAPIARITHTFIERLPDHNLRIFALGPRREKINDARRLLYSSLGLHFRTSLSLLYDHTPSSMSMKGTLYPISEDSALSWMFRGKSLARWRHVKSKENSSPISQSSSEEQQSVVTLETLQSALQGGLGLESQNGERLLTMEYEAIFGHVLHEAGLQMPPSHSIEDFAKDAESRVLCHNFPGSSYLTDNLEPLEANPLLDQVAAKTEISTYFLLRFSPSPWFIPDTFEHYPSLEMEFPIDLKTGEPVGTPTIYAVQSENIADLMLPSQGCDVRFTRRCMTPLGIGEDSPHKEGISSEELHRFIGESSLNPKVQFKLRASPHLNVTVAPMNKESPLIEKPNTIQYLFTGLEHRQSTLFNSSGFVLKHTAVEGGLTGGKRSELKLLCKPVVNESDGKEPQVAESKLSTKFINQALALAFSVNKPLARVL